MSNKISDFIRWSFSKILLPKFIRELKLGEAIAVFIIVVSIWMALIVIPYINNRKFVESIEQKQQASDALQEKLQDILDRLDIIIQHHDNSIHGQPAPATTKEK